MEGPSRRDGLHLLTESLVALCEMPVNNKYDILLYDIRFPMNESSAHEKRDFYHDGRFATLGDVLQHYNQLFGLGLGTPEINDLVEYLKSLSD